jgi:hypothetical protein
MAETKQNITTVRLSCEFRLATVEDLKVNAKQLRYGQLCALKSVQTGEFDGGFFTLNTNTDVAEIHHWFTNNQIYVPVNYFNNTIKEH